MAWREGLRQEARAGGRTPKNPVPGPTGEGGGMSAASKIIRTREESRRKLADAEKRDAEG